MHNRVTSHLWLKSALHASSHPCMCTCVLRCGCFLFTSPVFYFVPPFSFQPFQMFTSEFNERSRSNPLCDFRLGTVATSDHETPLTNRGTSVRVPRWLEVGVSPTERQCPCSERLHVAGCVHSVHERLFPSEPRLRHRGCLGKCLANEFCSSACNHGVGDQRSVSNVFIKLQCGALRVVLMHLVLCLKCMSITVVLGHVSY